VGLALHAPARLSSTRQFGGPTSARHWKLSDIETWERERAKQNGAL
jgi:hypothetical protein